MDFGRIDIRGVDFRLPEDAPITRRRVGQGAETRGRVYLGCPVWGNKEWVGEVYPPKTPAKDFLRAYAQHFDTVETNSTFYRLPDRVLMERWAEQVPPHFRFCVKTPQSISHAATDFASKRDEIQRFSASLEGLGEKLGLVFLQLPPQLHTGEKRLLADLLRAFPKDLPLALELRHPSWFQDRPQWTRLCDYLASEGRALVITDVAGRRDVLHMSVPASYALVRFAGHALDPSDFSRLDAWAERLAGWMQGGLERLYFTMHQKRDLDCVPLVRYFAKVLQERAEGFEVMRPLASLAS